MDKRTALQPLSLPSESSHGGREPASCIPCGVCQREIPWSVVLWREGSDYVAYFCGLSCYDWWRDPSDGL